MLQSVIDILCCGLWLILYAVGLCCVSLWYYGTVTSRWSSVAVMGLLPTSDLCSKNTQVNRLCISCSFCQT